MFISGYCRIKNFTIDNSGTRSTIEAGSLEDFQLKMYDRLSPEYPKFYKMDSQSRMGFLASEILLKKNAIADYQPETVSLVLSNRHASLDADIRYNETVAVAPSPSLFVYTLANIVAGEICIRHGLKGENAFFISPSFDATLLRHYADLVLADEGAHACVVGWVDVLHEQHDVLLYLVEKKKRGLALEHNDAQVNKLY